MYPDDAEALCIESRYKEEAGDIDGARTVIEKASRDAQPDQQAPVALELASFYFRQQLWAEAVQAYEAILGPQMPPSIRFHYVVALMRSRSACAVASRRAASRFVPARVGASGSANAGLLRL
jgi:tetratricopeptide (TPR) repeat protein